MVMDVMEIIYFQFHFLAWYLVYVDNRNGCRCIYHRTLFFRVKNYFQNNVASLSFYRAKCTILVDK